MILALLTSLLTVSSAQAAPSNPESLLKFEYRVTCDPADDASFPGIIAEIRVGSRRLRAYLFRYQTSQVVTLGAPTVNQIDGLKIRYLRHSSCKVEEVHTRIENPPEDSLALKHSPYLVLRPDQESVPDRDVPFHIASSRFSHEDGGFSIRYTIYFSNETDSGPFATTKSKSQALWGRRTDIEWIYQVDFNAAGKVVGRTHQGGILLGIGHSTKTFRGKFLKGTQHPILYDIARHNVFADRPDPGQSFKTAAAHLTPLEEIADPEAREDWMWRHPWTFDLSDRELRRTGELSYPSQDYLYVRLTGDIGGGKLVISGSEMTMERITLSRLGEDLWHRSDYTAFRIRQFPEAAQPLGKSIEFTPSTASVKVDGFQFLRLIPDVEEGFKVQDVTALFRCASGSCRY